MNITHANEPLRALCIVMGSVTDRPILLSRDMALIERLSKRGIRFIVRAHEVDVTSPQVEKYAESLAALGIRFDATRARNRLVDMTFDLLWGWRAIRSDNISVVFSRGLAASLVNVALRRLCGVGFVYRSSGLIAEEQAALGQVKRGGLAHRALIWAERMIYTHSDAVFCVSSPMQEYVRTMAPKTATFLTPNAVDIERFRYDPEMRRKTRARLRLDDHFLCVFSGASWKWEMLEETAKAFSAFAKAVPRAYLLAIVYDPDRVQPLLARHLGSNQFTVMTVPWHEMPSLLMAGDMGLLPRSRDLVSRVASPIKFGEYLACGMPVLITAGIGDFSDMVKEHQLGVVVEDVADTAAVAAGAQRLMDLVNRDGDALRRKCADFARKELGWDRIIEESERAFRHAASCARQQSGHPR